ncbi:RNA polymerase sigma factor [Pedobacter sp. ASV28]|uniref:RNA polymerase sigma factor n=1 Tax=Pedobacter sp. ASV28 TaxID=2795123 RepID=UPI0018EDB532|nr:sigma-70 family RNA polymerase sigma factor [Pedobacter sp. ASV28]
MRQSEFDHIFLSYHAALCSYAKGIVRDAHIAEDLVEDVFMTVLQRNPLKPPIIDWRNFLYAAVRKTCYKHLGRTAPLQPLEAAALEASEEIDNEQLYREIYRQVMQALDELPDKCGKVIRMSFMDNKSTSEIAQELGITESTVYNHKAKGLSLLRKMLSGVAFYSFFHLH